MGSDSDANEMVCELADAVGVAPDRLRIVGADFDANAATMTIAQVPAGAGAAAVDVADALAALDESALPDGVLAVSVAVEPAARRRAAGGALRGALVAIVFALLAVAMRLVLAAAAPPPPTPALACRWTWGGCTPLDAATTDCRFSLAGVVPTCTAVPK